MNKLKKALAKLGAKERVIVKKILLKLLDGELFGMNIQKLQGHNDIFRIRKGDIRIIYQQNDGNISILTIERRLENTYRDF